MKNSSLWILAALGAFVLYIFTKMKNPQAASNPGGLAVLTSPSGTSSGILTPVSGALPIFSGLSAFVSDLTSGTAPGSTLSQESIDSSLDTSSGLYGIDTGAAYIAPTSAPDLGAAGNEAPPSLAFLQ